MTKFDFDYETRKNEIVGEEYANFQRLKEFFKEEEYNGDTSLLSPFKEHLLNTYRNSIIVSIYSLSEQLLKSSLYKLLDVRFNTEEQSLKDKYILKQMPPATYPITPNLERIQKELGVYRGKFKLYSHSITKRYEDAYKKIINARHKIAHEGKLNNNEDELEGYFLDAIKYIDYLKVNYDGIIKNESEIFNVLDNLFKLPKCLTEFKKFETYKNFDKAKDVPSKNSTKSRLVEITEIIDMIESYSESYDDFNIDYITDIYEPLKKAFDILFESNEVSYSDNYKDFCNTLSGF
ncbi:hypothetical protein [Streptococcus sanguinis]|uniref:hypothetical protein n=1 Tax=Streptococcus sanguinis TaxID=1305 RepID=UPI003D055F74